MGGNALALTFAKQGAGTENRFRRAVAFGTGGEKKRGVRERELRFRHTDEIAGLLSGDGDRECAGIRQADVLARQNNEASGDKARIFSAFEHDGEPVNGGVRMLPRTDLMKAEIVS